MSIGLRLAIAAHYNSNAAGRWRQLAMESPLDWTYLTAEARNSGLAPLLLSSIERVAGVAVPDEVHSELKRERVIAATQNLLILDELKKLSFLLDSEDIDFLVLKGPALLELAYASYELRPMGDLDLLLLFDRSTEVRDLLLKSGYEDLSPFPFQDDSGLCFNEKVLSKREGSPSLIELHWHLIDNPYYAMKIPTVDLFQRSIALPFDGALAQALSLEDQLLHLSCHHVFHHQAGMVRTGADVAFLVHNQSGVLDWDQIVRRATLYDLLWPLKRVLEEAAEIWLAKVPKEILDQLSGERPSPRQRFFIASQGSEFGKVSRTFTTLPGISLKFRFVRGLLFPSREYMRRRYDITPSTPRLLALSKRYKSGLRRLIGELLG